MIGGWYALIGIKLRNVWLREKVLNSLGFGTMLALRPNIVH